MDKLCLTALSIDFLPIVIEFRGGAASASRSFLLVTGRICSFDEKFFHMLFMSARDCCQEVVVGAIIVPFVENCDEGGSAFRSSTVMPSPAEGSPMTEGLKAFEEFFGIDCVRYLVLKDSALAALRRLRLPGLDKLGEASNGELTGDGVAGMIFGVLGASPFASLASSKALLLNDDLLVCSLMRGLERAGGGGDDDDDGDGDDEADPYGEGALSLEFARFRLLLFTRASISRDLLLLLLNWTQRIELEENPKIDKLEST